MANVSLHIARLAPQHHHRPGRDGPDRAGEEVAGLLGFWRIITNSCALLTRNTAGYPRGRR